MLLHPHDAHYYFPKESDEVRNEGIREFVFHGFRTTRWTSKMSLKDSNKINTYFYNATIFFII